MSIEIFGYICSILVGLSLGLIGGGGSILTVPILVYLFQKTPLEATKYSLPIVGLCALVGAFSYFQDRQVQVKAALQFALPSFVGVYFSRALLLPAIPDPILNGDFFLLSKNNFIMILFSLVMFFASLSMIRTHKPKETKNPHPFQIIPIGLMVGVLTALIGVGGGFLIVPALVIFLATPMKLAIGTSLLIIALNSLFGFSVELIKGTVFNYNLISILVALSIIGLIFGKKMQKKISAQNLKKGFGYFTLMISILILFLQKY